MSEYVEQDKVWLIFPSGATVKSLSEAFNAIPTTGWYCGLNHGDPSGRVAISVQCEVGEVEKIRAHMIKNGGSMVEGDDPWKK